MTIDVYTSPETDKNENVGIGDALVAMPAMFGLRQRYPDADIRLNVTDRQLPWAKLFWSNSWVSAGSPSQQSFRTCSTGHWKTEDQLAIKNGMNRAQLICHRFGVDPTPVDGLIIDTAAANSLKTPKENKKTVLISAQSISLLRVWPSAYFTRIAIDLSERGVRVIYIGLSGLPKAQEEFVKSKGVSFLGNTNAQDAAVLMAGSNLLIANDSGMAHLAGTLGLSTIAVCGASSGKVALGYYPSVEIVQSNKECSGCCLDPASGYVDHCLLGCMALFEVSPDTVLEKAAKMLNLPPVEPQFKIV